VSEVEALLVQLADDPDNATLLAVLGDLLEGQGDPRGELIAMQLGLRTSSVADAVAIARRRNQLRDQLTPPIPSALEPWLRAKFQWGIGFVRSLDLGILWSSQRPLFDALATDGEVLGAALGELWAHPSMRFLREVIAHHAGAGALLATNPPAMARALTISRGAINVPPGVMNDVDAVGVVLAGIPRLERLRIATDFELQRIVHPAVTSLVLENWTGFFPLDRLARAALPALRGLRVVCTESELEHADFCDDLSRGGWLGQLDRLAIHTLDAPSPRSAQILATGLAGRRLEQLDLGTQPVDRTVLDALVPLAREVVAKPAG
jgi:uncharacterized protein (TIGR02996 family)